MPDIVGFRAKIAVIVPSTNTMVETDFNRVFGIPGVTFHAARMYFEDPTLDSNDAFMRLLDRVDRAFETAVRDVLTCEPNYLVMGMSAPTFWGGRAGNAAFLQRARRLCGIGVTTGAEACSKALEALGARRIAVLTPYQPIMRAQIVRYFEESGFTVVRSIDLQCPSATAIAAVTPDELRGVLREIDSPDVDAILQAGTNLSMVRLAAEAEGWLGKPVVAINAALAWHAYRANGFDDRLYDCGRLLSNY
ncbi:MAG: arylmalonate decarboxylase [Alphaproteobacteria bacterium]|nr:arylmalonate decarboxylase [Alphaproteobacteria bacterium]MCY4320286.1 arylmalonate decarboxylase [Alphaproteobacteria bacterium]